MIRMLREMADNGALIEISEEAEILSTLGIGVVCVAFGAKNLCVLIN